MPGPRRSCLQILKLSGQTRARPARSPGSPQHPATPARRQACQLSTRWRRLEASLGYMISRAKSNTQVKGGKVVQLPTGRPGAPGSLKGSPRAASTSRRKSPAVGHFRHCLQCFRLQGPVYELRTLRTGLSGSQRQRRGQVS